jgi:hypothetical protein
LVWWKVAQKQGVVRPETSPAREQWMRRVGPSGQDHAAGAGQVDAGLLALLAGGVGLAQRQRVFRLQEIRRKPLLREVGKIFSALQADANRVAAGSRLDFRDDAVEKVFERPFLVENVEGASPHFAEFFGPLAFRDVLDGPDD